MKEPIITLLTDFGRKDTYVATMKGVILDICPNTKIIDLSHEIEKFNVKQAGFILLQVTPFFPKGTIHLVVVDPGVGTKRRRIIVQGKQGLYVGPDNGVIYPAIQREGWEQIVEITEKKFMLPNPSNTFEGRDVFAPVAAYLANGVSINAFGPRISSIVKLTFSEPINVGNKTIGEVVHIDGFGNITTNIHRNHLKEQLKSDYDSIFKVKINNTEKSATLSKSYGSVSPGNLTLVIGSSNYLEVTVNQGNASELFRVSLGDKVEVMKEG